MLLDIVGVVLGRPSFVHGVEVETSVVVLDGLEERSESILETTNSKPTDSDLRHHFRAAPAPFSDGTVLTPIIN